MKKIFLLAILTFSLNGFSQVPPYVPTLGLTGWWPFNGNANDESGGANHCTAFNGSTLSNDRFGNPNSAYFLDGIDDWINTNATFLQTDQPHSISMWWRTTDSTKNSQTLFNTGPHTLENCAFHYSSVSSTPPYGIAYGLGDGIGGWNIMHPDLGQIITTPSTNALWHHLVWIKDASLNWTFYFDAVLIHTFNSAVNTGNPIADLRFGAENNGIPTGGANFLGNLDDIGVWNRAITSTEVSNLFYGSSVGIVDSQNNIAFSIFPNPANDLITVKVNATQINSTYNIVDVLGKTVLTGKVASETTNISINDLSKGVYLLKVNGKNSQSFKIVKQ